MAAKPKRDLTVAEQLAAGPVDLPFLMLVLLLTGTGLVMVFSASFASAYYNEAMTGNNPTYFIQRQAAFAVAGLVIMWLISKVNYQNLRWISIFVLAGAGILMLLVLVPGLGQSAGGAQRWIKLPMLPQFQPSEVLKLGIILYFSARLDKRNTEKQLTFSKRTFKGRFATLLQRWGFWELLPYVVILAISGALLLLQPHMSATILIFAVAASLLFVGGIRLGWFVAGILLVGALLAMVIFNTDYMSARIDIWKDPWSAPQEGGFQTIQSLYAIGSGGLFGLGLGNSRQKFLYIPEPENDFIFSIVCEELGFVGGVIILALFALLILRGYWLAIHARDGFGSLLVVGVTTQLAVQTFLNIAVVTNLIPVTGISLPFFSYGGTALVMQLASMGVILGVSRQILAPKSG